MSAKELIRDIQAACNNNLDREVVFRAMFEVNVSSSESDEGKQIELSFKDCIIRTDHPSKIKIVVC